MSENIYPAYTFGLELEVERMPIGAIVNDLNDFGFTTRHDASVESKGNTLLGRPVYFINNTGLKTRSTTFGGEFASEPFIPEYAGWGEKVVAALTMLSLDAQHVNERSGIHVHINVGKSLTTEQLKSIIRWGTRLESIMYRIGSFKETHRGVSNNYNYCRPICGDGPAVVPVPNGFAQVFNTYDLITHERKYLEFWDAYGDLANTSWQYHPVRYHWLNLKPIRDQGTLEFRLFNQTFDPYYVEAIIALCQAISHMMMSISKYSDIETLGFTPINSIYDPAGEDNDYRLLEFIINSGQQFFSHETASTVIKLYQDGSFQSIVPGKTLSHMIEKRNFRLFENTDYKPKLVDEAKLIKPKYVDSHNIRGAVNDPADLLKFFRKKTKTFDIPDDPELTNNDRIRNEMRDVLNRMRPIASSDTTTTVAVASTDNSWSMDFDEEELYDEDEE